MFSYWERQSYFRYDHIVVGAGITGLSTAIELKAVYPEESVLVIEQGLIPAGASTKNAGFACMGSVTELLDDLEDMSEYEVVSLFQQRKSGLELLRKRLGDANIGYAANGSYELINEHAKEALKKIDYLNELLQPVNKKAAFRMVNEKVKTFGFAEKQVHALIENTCEGELDTGMMMRALLRYAQQKGVEIITGATVENYTEDGKGVVVGVSGGYKLHCQTLSICTNAFAKQLLPGEDVQPGRGQVLITKPVRDLKLKGVFHFDKGYFYFREIDGRVLIGGGRNIDFEKETTFSKDVTAEIQDALEQKLRDVVLPDTAFEVDMRWGGTMAFGKDKTPVIKSFSKRVYGAFRMGGMGVAIGSEAGRQLAELNKKALVEK